jgi:hypothetical protein
MDMRDDIVILWPDNWWDGPVSGIATDGYRHYWFDAVFDEATDEFAQPRRLVAYELTDDEYARETERHKRWEEVGGTSYCFHLPVEQRRRPYRSQEALQEFYDEENAQPRPDYTSREPRGWFVPGPLRRS